MDAEHRHELKTNELADWLGHLPQYLKDNTNTIIGVALICVGLITWPMFNKLSKQKDIAEQAAMTQSIQMLDQDVLNVLRAPEENPLAQTEALNTMMLNADELIANAAETDNPNLAALALIKGAQAIRTQLHLRTTLDIETLETQIEKAQQAYQKAFETAQLPTLKAMAQLGLGLCSEELGQTAQAGEIYQQIVDDTAYQATVIPAQAQQRLDELDENAETFTFAEPPVTEAPELSVDPAAASPIMDTAIEAVETEMAENAPAGDTTEPTADTGETPTQTPEPAPAEE